MPRPKCHWASSWSRSCAHWVSPSPFWHAQGWSPDPWSSSGPRQLPARACATNGPALCLSLDCPSKACRSLNCSPGAAARRTLITSRMTGFGWTRSSRYELFDRRIAFRESRWFVGACSARGCLGLSVSCVATQAPSRIAWATRAPHPYQSAHSSFFDQVPLGTG